MDWQPINSNFHALRDGQTVWVRGRETREYGGKAFEKSLVVGSPQWKGYLQAGILLTWVDKA